MAARRPARRGRRRARWTRCARASGVAPPFMHGEAGRIVAAIFEAADAFDQDRDHVAIRGRADDAAHAVSSCRYLTGGFLRGRCQSRDLRPACARATVSSPAGASCAIVLPPPIVAPAPIVIGRYQHAVRADVHVVADDRAVLVRAVVVGGDRAGAVVDAAADDPRRRRTRGDSPSIRRPAYSPSPRRSCRCARLQPAVCRGAAARTGRCGSCGRSAADRDARTRRCACRRRRSRRAARNTGRWTRRRRGARRLRRRSRRRCAHRARTCRLPRMSMRCGIDDRRPREHQFFRAPALRDALEPGELRSIVDAERPTLRRYGAARTTGTPSAAAMPTTSVR